MVMARGICVQGSHGGITGMSAYKGPKGVADPGPLFQACQERAVRWRRTRVQDKVLERHPGFGRGAPIEDFQNLPRGKGLVPHRASGIEGQAARSVLLSSEDERGNFEGPQPSVFRVLGSNKHTPCFSAGQWGQGGGW